MPTEFTLGSLDLRTLAHEITLVSGWDTFPGLKYSATQYAYQHGEDMSGRRWYKPRNIDLHMILLATDATGVVTTTPLQHLQANLDALFAALHNSTGPLTLTRTMPDATVRTAEVRPIDASPVEDGTGITKAVVVSLRMGWPFWHGAAAEVSGTGPLAATNNGNAPVNDMLVTFTTTGRITTPAGDYVESAAAGAILNVRTGEVTGSGTPADISTNKPWFIQLEPGANSLTVTGGSKTINYFHSYF